MRSKITKLFSAETQKGIEKFTQLFKEQFCGLRRKKPLHRRPDKETAPHDSKRCEACQKGVCPLWKTTKIARNPCSFYDSDPYDDDDDYPDWAPPIKCSKVELKTAVDSLASTNYVKKSSSKRHTEIVKIRVNATPQEKVTKSVTKVSCSVRSLTSKTSSNNDQPP